MPSTLSGIPSASFVSSAGVTGDGRPFSLFLLRSTSPCSGLGGPTASLLGAGVNGLSACLVGCLAELLGAVGVEAAFWKKLTILRWPFSALDDVTVFLTVGLGVEISLPSIPRAIGGDGELPELKVERDGKDARRGDAPKNKVSGKSSDQAELQKIPKIEHQSSIQCQMASQFVNSTSPYICRRCTRRLFPQLIQKRRIHENTLQKRLEAEWKWKALAQEIEAGQRKGMLPILEERGFINQIAGTRDELNHLLTWKRVGAYVGIDPTAPSMHVGHMVPFMALFWMYLHGFHTVTLVGGGTAKIGDPTGRKEAREKQQRATRTANMVAIHYQLKKLWMNVEGMGRKFGYVREWAWHRELCNNHTWLQKQSVLDILALMGSGMRLGPLLSRDTVKMRMEQGDGMSVAEFFYPVLQAWDWWHMYSTKNIQLQIGGADQYGNIVSGVDALKHVIKTHGDAAFRQRIGSDSLPDPMGFTVPLLTTSAGEKFGKSAGNAIWLDKDMTSVFDLYGYFVGTPDADVEKLLKLLTFLPLPEIARTMDAHKKAPEQRTAQHLLASKFVELVHGPEDAREAAKQHKALFQNRGRLSLSDLKSLSTTTSSQPPPTAATPGLVQTPAELAELAKTGKKGYQNVSLDKTTPPVTHNTAGANATIVLPCSLVIDQPFPRVLFHAGLVNSRSEGHRLVAAQGAYIGSKPDKLGGLDGHLTWTPVKMLPGSETEKYLVEDELLVLRIGKWKVRVVRVVPDEEFESMGLPDPPGWQEWKVMNKDGEEKGRTAAGNM